MSWVSRVETLSGLVARVGIFNPVPVALPVPTELFCGFRPRVPVRGKIQVCRLGEANMAGLL